MLRSVLVTRVLLLRLIAMGAVCLILDSCTNESVSNSPPASISPVAVPAETKVDPTLQKMDVETARAMLSRFGYGATPASLQQAQQMSMQEYIQVAITGSSHLPDPVAKTLDDLPVSKPVSRVWKLYGWSGSELDGKKQTPAEAIAYLDRLRKMKRTYLNAAIQARLLTMANADNQGHEILLSFWLNHFSIYGPKKEISLLAWDYAKTLEQAMQEDSFPALLRASFYHPAMQLYLDNELSTGVNSKTARKAGKYGDETRYGINENLARELMELHTMGVDAGYSQRDIQQLARIISGSGVYAPNMTYHIIKISGATKKELFLFDPRRHDYGEKIFLNYTFPASVGIEEIDRALDILARHPTTARNISRKLAIRFLSDHPPEHIVDAMTEAYLASGGKISATLQPLLQSTEFADSLQQPMKYKEPLDYLLSYARAVCGDTPINNGFFLAATAYNMGEAPFYHSSPDGYGDEENDWLSPPAITKRLQMAMNLSTTTPPFAAAHNHDIPHLFAIYERNRQELLAGTACVPDLQRLSATTGLPGTHSAPLSQSLDAIDKMRFILASHEFMYR